MKCNSRVAFHQFPIAKIQQYLLPASTKKVLFDKTPYFFDETPISIDKIVSLFPYTYIYICVAWWQPSKMNIRALREAAMGRQSPTPCNRPKIKPLNLGFDPIKKVAVFSKNLPRFLENLPRFLENLPTF